MCCLLSFYSRPALIILSRASFILSSFAQRLMRMYRLPLLPKMNPGVMNTLALWSTASVKSSTSASAVVLNVVFAVPLWCVSVESLSRGELYATECAVFYVALNLEHP